MKDQLLRVLLDKAGPNRDGVKKSDDYVSDSFVGIEIELEYGNFLAQELVASKHWELKRDGSLRPREEGWELVSRPVAGEDINTALQEYALGFYNLKKRGLKSPVTSIRTAIHVHVNVLDMTFQQYINFNLLYYIFESALLNFCMPYRRGNIFCLPVDLANDIMRELSTIILTEGDIRKFNTALSRLKPVRYGAVSRFATYQHGTLEFRALETTLDIDRIKVWINILLSLKEYAMSLPKGELGLVEFAERGSKNGANELLKEVFGKYSEHLEYQELDMDFLTGIRYMQDALFSFSLRGCSDSFVRTRVDSHRNAPYKKFFKNNQKSNGG